MMFIFNFHKIPKKLLPKFGIKRYYSSKILDKEKKIGKYVSAEVERKWYSWWKSNHYFNNAKSKEKFVMVLPPPNITGSLHMGHALTCTLQDTLARWHRMKRKDVVWVPGFDHAGIATQGIVEKHLLHTKNITRRDLGREKFIAEIWKWYGEKGNIISKQLRRLGATLDWSKSVFTLNKEMNNSVNEAFIQLFESNLIYRQNKIINWCCHLQSVISDIEVDHEEISGPTHINLPGYADKVLVGELYTISYPVSNSTETVEISTTRPETMIGDTAIMVHPDDGRYKHLHGKTVYNIFREEDIPIICDQNVNPKFGTGVVKVTPGHSLTDYNVALRHDLKIINILNDDGSINHIGGMFKGQDRFTARVNLINKLKEMNLYKCCEPHSMMIPRCSRTQDVIEPLLKPQWYLKIENMIESANEAVKNGSLKIEPEYQKNIWNEWTKKTLKDNIDWCISRQLWWGHQIPVYLLTLENHSNLHIAAHSIEDAYTIAKVKHGIEKGKITSLVQETDVLDTWFSSALFPFASLGWPKNTKNYNDYYPTSTLVTGRDILFFWVIRMVMLGQTLTKQLPFQEVLAHGLVFDSEGKKMSKSKGNVIDPINVISDIENISEENHTKCGADALRYTLCSLDLKEEVVKFDMRELENNAKFMNKIWNAFRFFLHNEYVGNNFKALKCIEKNDFADLSLIDKWILSKLSSSIGEINDTLSSYDLNVTTQSLYNFWYKYLCDIYLEAIKPIVQSNSKEKALSLSTLLTCLEQGLILSSPVIPFISEELYQYLPGQDKKESVMQLNYPQFPDWSWCHNKELEELIDNCLPICQSIRSLKVDYNLKSHKNLSCTIITEDILILEHSNNLSPLIANLSKVNNVNIISKETNFEKLKCIALPVSASTTTFLHIEGIIDVSAEIVRLKGRILSLQNREKKLLNRKKNTHKIQEIKDKLDQTEILIKNLQRAS